MTEFGRSASKGCGWVFGCLVAPIILLVGIVFFITVIAALSDRGTPAQPEVTKVKAKASR